MLTLNTITYFCLRVLKIYAFRYVRMLIISSILIFPLFLSFSRSLFFLFHIRFRLNFILSRVSRSSVRRPRCINVIEVGGSIYLPLIGLLFARQVNHLKSLVTLPLENVRSLRRSSFEIIYSLNLDSLIFFHIVFHCTRIRLNR